MKSVRQRRRNIVHPFSVESKTKWVQMNSQNRSKLTGPEEELLVVGGVVEARWGSGAEGILREFGTDVHRHTHCCV